MIVECAVYENGSKRPGEIELEHACEAAAQPGTFSWIDLYEPTPDEFDALRREFGLHPLAIEDALEAHQRPKLERYGDVLFGVLKTVRYDDLRERVTFGEVMIFAGESFVITVRHGEARDLDDVKHHFGEEPEKLRRSPIGVLHAVLDKVIDDYEPVVEGLQQDVDEVEEGLFDPVNGESGATRRIYRLGREVLSFSRAVTPLVEPVRAVAEGDVVEIPEELRSYFRDVADHLARVDGWVSAHRELLSNLLQANLTEVSIKQNEDMRKISAWVAIAAIPTLIAGIYGMNFDHMPELHWKVGYPYAITLMLVVCGFLFTRFKRAGWL